MGNLPELIVQNYNPNLHADGVEANLRHAGQFVDGQDSRDRLADFVSRMPSAVMVATPEDGHEVYGNVSVPDSQIPLISRLVVSSLVTAEKDVLEVMRLLYNASFDALRERGMPHAEELFDWETPRSEPINDAQLEFSKRAGFYYAFDLRGMKRDFRNPDGTPVPNIPPLD